MTFDDLKQLKSLKVTQLFSTNPPEYLKTAACWSSGYAVCVVEANLQRKPAPTEMPRNHHFSIIDKVTALVAEFVVVVVVVVVPVPIPKSAFISVFCRNVGQKVEM